MPVRNIIRAHSTWHNGHLYWGGGMTLDSRKLIPELAQLYAYSPGSNKWSVIKTPTCWFGLTTFKNNLVIAGGKIYPDDKRTSAIYVHNEKGWQDDIIPYMQKERSSPTAIGIEQLLIVAGGRDDDSALNIVEVFKDGQWWKTNSLPQGCYRMAATLHSDRLYLHRGEAQGKKVFHCEVESLNSSPQWETMDAPLEYSSFISYKGLLLSIGGGLWDSPQDSISAFFTNRWRNIGILPHGISSTCTAIVQSTHVAGQTEHIVTIGGYTGSSSNFSSHVYKILSSQGKLIS